MPARGKEKRPPRLPDEVLEHYGTLFVTLGIAASARISFEQFLEAPEAHLSRIAPPPSPPPPRGWVWSRRGLVPLLVVALATCPGQSAGPEGVARAFVDRYYDAADPGAAMPFASGLARQKLEEEQRLAGETVADPRAREREVEATLEEQRQPGEDRVFFTFLVTVRIGAVSLRKRVLVATGRQEGEWRVTNYRETDL